jgi:NADH-quinone oxidoreductase subunit M
MLVAILGLAFLHRSEEGRYSFAYEDLLQLDTGRAGLWLFLGFLIAFAVKLPAVPLHTWLPDAHTEAPTAGSLLLAGLLLKTGAYGLLRFAVPLFPEAARLLAPVAMAVGALGVLYGALLAFAQSDLKRLVAYTSVSHLGFVLIGVFAWNRLALQGVVMQMICHGLSTGALFVLAGGIQERLHTRELGRLGGLHAVAPRLSLLALCFALASLGLPGLGNFVAELLVLLGAFEASPAATVAAAIGLVPATVYSLWILQRVFHGPLGDAVSRAAFRDLSWRELATQIAFLVPLVWLGFYPQPVLDQATPALDALERVASRPPGEEPP